MISLKHDGDRMRFYEGVAQSIKESRASLGLSQRVFAEKVGVTHSMIVSIENGATPCSLYLLSKIAELLDTTIDALAPVQIDAVEGR